MIKEIGKQVNRLAKVLTNNNIVNNFGIIFVIILLLVLLKVSYDNYIFCQNTNIVETFSNLDNYFIMDENKNNYIYFTDDLDAEKNVHSSSSLSYQLNAIPYNMLPFTMNIDFAESTITQILPSVRHFGNNRTLTLEKASGMNVNDTLFYISYTSLDGNIKYLNKSYERNFTTRSYPSVFNVDDSDKINSAMKIRLVRQEEAQTAIRRFNPFIGKPNLVIHPNSSQIDIDFEINPSMVSQVDNFVIVLGKYDKDKNNIGHLKVHTSKENNQGGDICTSEMGRRKCKYSLSDIDHIDNNGDILYYRVGVIGVSANNVISNYSEPNYPGGYTHFVMTKTVQDMEEIISNARNQNMTQAQRDRINNQLISDAGGEYEFIKKQLGGYPDNLILDINKHTLNDLVSETMSLGEINVVID